MSNNLPQRDLW